jgi:hypothetical protein
MNEEQEREVDLRVRERLTDERMKRMDRQIKWMDRVGLGILAALVLFVLLDNLVTCEARRIVKEELHK